MRPGCATRYVLLEARGELGRGARPFFFAPLLLAQPGLLDGFVVPAAWFAEGPGAFVDLCPPRSPSVRTFFASAGKDPRRYHFREGGEPGRGARPFLFIPASSRPSARSSNAGVFIERSGPLVESGRRPPGADPTFSTGFTAPVRGRREKRRARQGGSPLFLSSCRPAPAGRRSPAADPPSDARIRLRRPQTRRSPGARG